MAQLSSEPMEKSPKSAPPEGDSVPQSPETGSAPQSLETASPVDIAKNMKNLKDQLIELLNPDFGLLDHLTKARALSRVEVAEVKGEKIIFKRNEKLLETIIQKGKCDELMEALSKTNQTHLVNFVKANGEYSPKFNLFWPLMEKQMDILDDNRVSLVNILDTSELVTRLYSADVFSKMHRDFIATKPTEYDKNSAFLDLLSQCSLAGYYKTIQCLNDSNQSHVADILKSGGTVVGVSANLNVDAENVNAVEEQVVDKIAISLLESNLSPDEVSRYLKLVELRVIAMKRGNSIDLYIYCKTMNELTYLCEMMEVGRLKSFLEKLFNMVLQDKQLRILILKFFDGAIERAKKSFERESIRDKSLDEEISKLVEQEHCEEHIQEEVAIILEEVAPIQAGRDDDEDFAVDVIKNWQLEEGTDTQKLRGHHPSTDYSDTEKLGAILRSNSEFFNEYIHPTSAFISLLHSSKCLTDDEMRHIKALGDNTEKNDEILNSIKEDKYGEFIKCLRTSGQHLVAHVVEKGGAVLRVGVEFKDQSHPSLEKEIVEKINMLQDKSQVPNEEVARMLSLLNKGNTEILGAQHDDGMVIWLWCQSKDAFTRITKMNEAEKVNELLLWLFNKLLNNKLPQQAEIEVDIEESEMEFVCRSLPEANVTATLPSSELGTICGVTKLQGHIYVLCQKPSSIRVFDDLDFSKSSKTIPLNEIEQPVDIAACSSTGSLYVSDTSSVWKVTIMDNKVTKWLENVGNPFTLSVTRKGEVVIVRRDKTCLEIYGPDAKKLYDIKLPDDCLPNHAVEISSGRFIVTSGENFAISKSIVEITKEGTVSEHGSFRYGPFSDLPHHTIHYLIPRERVCRLYLHHMTLDGHNGVYAADVLSGKVLQFDSRLVLRQIIEGLADNRQMSSLCMTQDNKLLMVVHGEPKKLDVYELTG